jgi:dTDP-4-dehydrorhamnose 3,5-epimerase
MPGWKPCATDWRTRVAVKLIRTRIHSDRRGWFSETYSREWLAQLGIDTVFVQDNSSLSKTAGVIRGLHFQRPPFAQAKLVRCVAGRVWDVAVDLRAGSPTYGQWVGHELTPENGLQLYAPVGFAHGFVSLEANTAVEYKVSQPYAPDSEGGLVWNDPDLALPWPLDGRDPLLSEKDLALPGLAGFESPFVYDGTPLAVDPA